MPLAIDDLTDAERALWEAFPTGAPADLRDRPDRTVRAEVIAALLRGAQPVAPGDGAAVTLLGARITGVLDLTGAHVEVPLHLNECVLDLAPVFINARVRTIEILNSELPGFSARLVQVDGDLNFRDSRIVGRLDLVRANIGSELMMRGVTLSSPGDFALFAGGVTVAGGFFGDRGRRTSSAMTVEGCCRLVGARLLGGLFFDGVHIDNPGQDAWQGDGMHVVGPMRCAKGFRADGKVRLRGVRVEGELSFESAVLAGEPVALALSNATLEVLDLRTADRIAGLVDLQHASCGLLRDWPSRTPEVALNGFTYGAIASEEWDVKSRLRWIGRDDDGYRPLPYEQLATFYRRLGADADARQVLLAKQRAHRRELRWPFRVVGHVLDWTVGYGYKPWRALLWLMLMVAVGTWVFTSTPPLPEGTVRHFDAVMYTLDLLLPISAFGLRDAFAPAGDTRWVAYGLTAAGWVLATALLAGVTRALRRD